MKYTNKMGMHIARMSEMFIITKLPHIILTWTFQPRMFHLKAFIVIVFKLYVIYFLCNRTLQDVKKD